MRMFVSGIVKMCGWVYGWVGVRERKRKRKREREREREWESKH